MGLRGTSFPNFCFQTTTLLPKTYFCKGRSLRTLSYSHEFYDLLTSTRLNFIYTNHTKMRLHFGIYKNCVTILFSTQNYLSYYRKCRYNFPMSIFFLNWYENYTHHSAGLNMATVLRIIITCGSSLMLLTRNIAGGLVSIIETESAGLSYGASICRCRPLLLLLIALLPQPFIHSVLFIFNLISTNLLVIAVTLSSLRHTSTW